MTGKEQSVQIYFCIGRGRRCCIYIECHGLGDTIISFFRSQWVDERNLGIGALKEKKRNGG